MMSDAEPLGPVDKLVARHQPLIERAMLAIRDRGYWSAFPESPSTKVWGEAAPAAGKAAFDSLLGKDFPLSTPGAEGFVVPEKSPYGIELGVRYPRVSASGVDELLAAAVRGMPEWRDAGPLVRAAVCVEILRRMEARSFEFAYAVMHTTGQGFVMAFQAGGAHALDRALEGIAYAYEAMSAVPKRVEWEKPARGEPRRLTKRFVVVPRGVALVIGCTTFPTWNSYPGFFASLVTGNPVVVKPHPRCVLPLALAVSVARSVLDEYGFDPNLVTLAAESPGEGLASVLAVRPEVRIIDFTGSSAYGQWLEANATQAVVFAEKSGVNAVVLDSTDDLPGMTANLAYSLALYSGQMCTTPQVLFVPSTGITVDGRVCRVDEFVSALTSALDGLLGRPAMAEAILGAIVNDDVLARLYAAGDRGEVAIASKELTSSEFPDARIRTPLVLRVDASHVEAYSAECFGPVGFIVETRDSAHSLELWRALTASRGALTASVYSTSSGVLTAAERVALDVGVSLSENLVKDVYVNQSSAFSDFHATGANPAANASLTDTAFVAHRFRVVELRRQR